MTKRIHIPAVLLTAFLPLMAQNPGSVTGMVLDDSGQPVVRARVFISAALPASTARPAAPPVITGPRVITTMTDQSGAFSSGHLPAGNYVACAQQAALPLLDPCHWASSAPGFTITAGKTTSGVSISMAKGTSLSIHVNDPHQLLASSTALLQDDLQFHVVTGKGHHYNAPLTGSSKNGRDHTITIPYGTALTVQVVSSHLVINDDAGQPASAAGRPVNAPAGSGTTHLTYTVSGTK